MKKVDKLLLIDDDSIANFVNRYLITWLDLTHELIVTHSVPSAKQALLSMMEKMDEKQANEYVILLDTKFEYFNKLLPSYFLGSLPPPQKESLYLIVISYNKYEDPSLSFRLEDTLDKPVTRDKLSLAWNKMN
ncbi:two-component SAPR family response regulator [Catalinimonas alkaloidigena]|uniref:hypothetical protein n=1 Tax=Catalinimonas alkaloidigena TaxID=1075417 RepID=UPI002407007D|nr:hypothetical protein [Catalinimonas alkaloidigena]MDF9796063.1 two-component SAPR family response regulator [Catalinimonas alkaloidigena]